MPAAAYPLQRLFFQHTESEVLAIRARASAIILEGKTIIETEGGGGQKSTKAFAMPPAQVLFECNAALRHLNPALYGRSRRKSYGHFGASSSCQ